MENKLEQLFQDQFKTYKRLKTLHKDIKKHSSRFEVNARLDLFLKDFYEFREKDAIIGKVAKENEVDISNEDYSKEDLQFHCELLYAELLDANLLNPPENYQRLKEATYEEKPPAVKLPKISVKKFSGNAVDWVEFRTEFHDLVISRSDLSDSQKFEHLKSALPKDIPLTFDTEVDFIQTWYRLDDIFKNVTLTGTLKKIIAHRECNTSKAIFELLEKTIKYLNELESLNINVHDRNGLFINVLVTKLNENTKIEWFDTFSYPDSPKLYDFLKFLNSKDVKKSLSGEIEKFNNYASCVCCKVKHPLWQCEKFKYKNYDEKLAFIKHKAICRRCLSPKHDIEECRKAYSCGICLSRDHHYLLHKKNY